jgi:ABC-type nickel/cobalt efflux system permease component RcnA
VTTRLVCRIEGSVPLVGAGARTDIVFVDGTFAERIGWREIVVLGDGVTVSGDVPAGGLSERLTSYPEGMLATPSDRSSVSFTVSAGGRALPPLVQPEIDAVGREAPAAQVLGAVPGGIGELGGELAALFEADELSVPIVLLSLLGAAALGALHALSPGHGKTVMAAYLIASRGTLRQALALGLTVTASHTIGVLLLGVVSLSASAVVPPERLYPILGLISGALVIVIGGWLLFDVVRARAAGWDRAGHDDTPSHHHRHAHAHAEEHAHPHADDHAHPHSDERAHLQADRDHHAAAHEDTRPQPAAHADGWHRHGPFGHSHAPRGPQPLRPRALVALGLAGGMVPSVSAIILLLGSIGAGRPAYGIALTVAFGIGMAVVLVGIGMLFVVARGTLERLSIGPRAARLGTFVPVGSAAVVLLAGLVITAQSLTTLA